jgi:D-beta-D-heptose 7-phosphate kinase/D-beta-D-heptose 1-phosphate adenosyltransferase
MVIDFNKLKNLNEINILVIGDIMLDKYLSGITNRISPEAPVPIIEVMHEEVMLGGAGNVVKNLVSFGAKCSIISIIGNDEAGKSVIDLVREQGLDVNMIIKENPRKTTQKNRIIVSGQQVIRFDNESKETISKESEKQIVDFLKINLTNYNAILISDSQKGMLSESLCKNIIELSNNNNIMVIVDPKGNDYSKYKNATLIKANLNESEIILNKKLKNNNEIEKGLIDLKELLNSKYVIITLAEKGIAFLDTSCQILPTKECHVYDVSGAGDTVLSSIAICLSKKLTLFESCLFSNLAASVVVKKSGSATTTLEEIINLN